MRSSHEASLRGRGGPILGEADWKRPPRRTGIRGCISVLKPRLFKPESVRGWLSRGRNPTFSAAPSAAPGRASDLNPPGARAPPRPLPLGQGWGERGPIPPLAGATGLEAVGGDCSTKHRRCPILDPAPPLPKPKPLPRLVKHRLSSALSQPGSWPPLPTTHTQRDR